MPSVTDGAEGGEAVGVTGAVGASSGRCGARSHAAKPANTGRITNARAFLSTAFIDVSCRGCACRSQCPRLAGTAPRRARLQDSQYGAPSIRCRCGDVHSEIISHPRRNIRDRRRRWGAQLREGYRAGRKRGAKPRADGLLGVKHWGMNMNRDRIEATGSDSAAMPTNKRTS